MVDIRVVVVADDPLARAGLSALLADQPGVAVIGQTAGSDFPAMLDVYRPDGVIWDVGWEGSSDAIATLKNGLEGLSEVAVIALIPDMAVSAEIWAAGPRGILLRDALPERLLAALGAACQGLAVIDPTLAETLLPVVPHPVEGTLPGDDLTPRETEVLHLLAEGLPNKTIARRMGISEHTVKFHINAVMSKLGAQSRTDAVVRATRRGLLIL